LDDLSEKGAEIIFAGHTHGGQVCWPITGRALVTNCDLPTRYARGLAELRDTKGKNFFLQVCAGLGHSIYAPIRFACRPEVRLLTLKAKS
jgi:predicted MPP superfamily phosphohydrolase